MPTLETERLQIRPLTPDDLDALHAALDGHPDVWRFDPGYPRTREQRAAELRYRILQYERDHYGMLAVCLKATGKLIGYCGLQLYLLPSQPYATPEVELFYKLARDFWGQGLATEACRRMIDHAFDTLRLRRIVTVTHKDNSNSIALLKRLGMTIVPAPPEWADHVLGTLANARHD